MQDLDAKIRLLIFEFVGSKRNPRGLTLTKKEITTAAKNGIDWRNLTFYDSGIFQISIILNRPVNKFLKSKRIHEDYILNYLENYGSSKGKILP